MREYRIRERKQNILKLVIKCFKALRKTGYPYEKSEGVINESVNEGMYIERKCSHKDRYRIEEPYRLHTGEGKNKYGDGLFFDST